MISSSNIRTAASLKTLIVMIAFALPLMAAAQNNWNATTNWLQTHYNTLGHQASPSWMMEQSSEAEALYASADGKSFAMVLPNEFDNAELLIESLQEPIVEGSGTMLMPVTAPNTLANATLSATYTGTIAGQRVTMLCIGQWSESGEGQTVVIVSAGLRAANWNTAETTEFALNLIKDSNNDSLAGK